MGHDRMAELIDAMKICRETRTEDIFGRPSHWWRNDIKVDLKDKKDGEGILVDRNRAQWGVGVLHEDGYTLTVWEVSWSWSSGFSYLQIPHILWNPRAPRFCFLMNPALRSVGSQINPVFTIACCLNSLQPIAVSSYWFFFYSGVPTKILHPLPHVCHTPILSSLILATSRSLSPTNAILY